MKKTKTIAAAAILGVTATVGLAACDKADRSSHNLSKDSDNFKIERRVVFVNGITDKYLLEIRGLCSIKKDNGDKQLEVTCKTGKDTYKKHFLGVSDNVTYFVEQLKGKNVSTKHYKVTYAPTTIIPDLENTSK